MLFGRPDAVPGPQRFGDASPRRSNGRVWTIEPGAGLDPAAALQLPVTLEPGQQVEVLFLLGQAESSRRFVQSDCALPKREPGRSVA